MWWINYQLVARVLVGSSADLELAVPGCLCPVVRPGAVFPALLLPLQTAHCKPGSCDVLWLMEKLGEKGFHQHTEVP